MDDSLGNVIGTFVIFFIWVGVGIYLGVTGAKEKNRDVISWDFAGASWGIFAYIILSILKTLPKKENAIKSNW